MEVEFFVKRIKRGTKTNGNEYCFLGIGDGCGGFVPAAKLPLFADVKENDVVLFDMYNFRNDGGIKLIPKSIVID